MRCLIAGRARILPCACARAGGLCCLLRARPVRARHPKTPQAVRACGAWNGALRCLQLAAARPLLNSTPISTGMMSEKYGTVIASSEWDSYVAPVSKLDADWTATTGYDRAVDQVLAGKNYTTVPLAVNLIGALPDEMQLIATQIGDIVKTQSWLAVYANDEAEFNTIVSDMIASAQELGLDELMEYNVSAWQKAVEMAADYQ